MPLGYMLVLKADGSQLLDLQCDALLTAGVEPGTCLGRATARRERQELGWGLPALPPPSRFTRRELGLTVVRLSLTRPSRAEIFARHHQPADHCPGFGAYR
jgi:hypothetical protein